MAILVYMWVHWRFSFKDHKRWLHGVWVRESVSVAASARVSCIPTLLATANDTYSTFISNTSPSYMDPGAPTIEHVHTEGTSEDEPRGSTWIPSMGFFCSSFSSRMMRPAAIELVTPPPLLIFPILYSVSFLGHPCCLCCIQFMKSCPVPQFSARPWISLGCFFCGLYETRRQTEHNE